MQRIPEPELMNDAHQAQAYAEADFSEPHTAFIDQLQKAHPHLPPSGHALDLGCGPADITLRFAKAFPQWTVDGLDAAEAMLEWGRKAIRTAIEADQITDRIVLQKAYLPRDDAPRSHYDFIFSNSLLHHLADPLDLWRSLQRWGAPTTPVFIMDLMRPESPAIAQALVDQYAQGEPDILRHDFYHSLLAAYTLEEVRTQLEQMDLRHLQVQAISDRHWIVWG